MKKILTLLLIFAMMVSMSSPLVQLGFAEDNTPEPVAEQIVQEEQPEAPAAEKTQTAPETKETSVPEETVKVAAVEVAESSGSEETSSTKTAESSGSEETSSTKTAAEDEKRDNAADAETVITEEEKEEEQPKEEEEKYPAISESTTTDGGVEVSVEAPEGAFPEGTKVVIKDVDSASVVNAANTILEGEAVDAKAVDISFVKDGEELEPKDGKKVSVSLRVKGWFSKVKGDDHYAVHIKDNGAAEVISADVTAKSADFRASDFSVYAIVGEEGSDDHYDRVQITFKNSTNILERQIVREGDAITMPDPTAQGRNKTLYFWVFGSNENDRVDAFTGRSLTGTDIEALKSKGAKVEGDEQNLWNIEANVVWRDGYIAYFHQGDKGSDNEKVICDTILSDDSNKVALESAIYVGDPNTKLTGWKVYDGTSVTNYDKTDVITITSTTHIYPNLLNGAWLNYDTGNGVKNIEAKFLAKDEGSGTATVRSDDLPTQASLGSNFNPGYELDGWYKSYDPETGEYTDKIEADYEITTNTVIYAKWVPATARYTVIHMVEGAQGTPGQGTYTQYSRESLTGTTGDSIPIPGTRITNYHIPGTDENYTGSDYSVNAYAENQKEIIIKGDGSSVKYVYHNRNRYKVNFSGILTTGYVKWGQDASYWDPAKKVRNRTYSNDKGYRRWEVNSAEFLSYGQNAFGAKGYNDKASLTATERTVTYEHPVIEYYYFECIPGVDYSGKAVRTVTCGGVTKRLYFDSVKIWHSGMKTANKSNFDHGYYYGANGALTGWAFKDSSGIQKAATTSTATAHYGFTSTYNGKQYKCSYDKYIARAKRTLSFAGTEGADTSADLSSKSVYYDAPLAGYDPGFVKGETTRKYEGKESVFYGWFSTQEAAADPTADINVINFSTRKMPSVNTTAYAGWVPKTYEITFNANGGTFPAGEGEEPSDTLSKEYESGTVLDRPFEPTKVVDGKAWQFYGWYQDEECKKPVAFGSYTVDKDATLYAKWILGEKYELNYYDENGTPIDGISGTEYFAGANISLASAEEAGFEGDKVLTGWSTAKGDNTKIVSNNLQMNKAYDLYAIVEDAGYPGGPGVDLMTNYPKKSGKTDSTYDTLDTRLKNDQIKVNSGSPEAPVAGGVTYEFYAWNTEKDGTGVIYQAGDYAGVPEDSELYAMWKEKYNSDSKDHLKYRANSDDATGSTADTIGDTFTNVTVADSGFIREGYSVTGWNTAADGSGTAYAADSSYFLTSEDDILYAQWDINSHDVKYEYSGEVPPNPPALPETKSYEYNANVSIAADPAAVEGYTFKGWKSGDKDAANFNMPDKEVTITGVWEKNSHKVTYKYTGTVPKDAAAVPVETTHKYGDTVNVADAPANVEGYTFDGWKKDGSALNSFTMPDADVEITGNWTINSYNVTYKYEGTVPGGAVNPPSQTSHEYDSDVTIAATPAAVEGYTFSGWKINGADAADFKMPAHNVEVIGTWTKNRHKVTYSYENAPADAPALPTEATYEYGTNVAIAAPPSLAGYTFEGWKIGDDDAASFPMPDSDVNITGKWTINTYNISYELNISEGETATYEDGFDNNPDTYDVTTDTFKLKNPVSKTLGTTTVSFKGWTGTGITGGPSKDVTVPKGSTGDRSYTAVWDKPPYLNAKDIRVKSGTELGDALKMAEIKAQDVNDGPDVSGITPDSEIIDDGGKQMIGKIEITDDGGYDPDTPGQYTVKIKYTNEEGSTVYKDVVITVDAPPTINASDIEVGDGTSIDDALSAMGVNATDNDNNGGAYNKGTEVVETLPDDDDMEVGKIYVDKGNYNPDKAGTYTITMKVRDKIGNVTTKTATITVNEKPKLSATPVTVGEGTSLNVAFGKTNPTATDNEDGDISEKIRIANDGGYNPKVSGTYTITYEVTDSYNQTITKEVQITVDLKPVIEAGDVIVGEDTPIGDVIKSINVSDAEDGTIENKVFGKIPPDEEMQPDTIYVDDSEYDPNKPGKQKITIKVKDTLGQVTTKEIEVTVNAKPKIDIKVDKVVPGTPFTDVIKDIKVTDEEDGPIENKVVGPIPPDEELEPDTIYIDDGGYDPNKPGKYKVTVKVKDQFGQIVTKTFELTVSDFVNTSDKTIGDPPVEKQIKGDKPATDSEFVFEMAPLEEGNPMQANAVNGRLRVTVKGAGSEEFGNIEFRRTGTYRYSISEINTGEDGYTYSTDVYKVIYEVKDVNGEMVCTRYILDAQGRAAKTCTFVNNYDAGGKGVETGDDNNIVLYSLTTLTGAALLAIFALRRRREEGKTK